MLQRSAPRNGGYSPLETVVALGRLGVFAIGVLSHVPRHPFEFRTLLRQLRFIGSQTVPVIAVAGCFVGMVVALQFYDTLVRFGSISLLGSAVGLSLIRELAPVLSALILIGRAGSATCAEIGIMRTDSQIDALETMAIDPFRYLLVPRFLAFFISLPLLTAIFNVVGLFGGWVMGVYIFDLSGGVYISSMRDSIVLHDVSMGLVKSVAFAAIIAWICMGKSFLMHLDRRVVLGAAGVSAVTTEAVVASSISVLLADYIISAIML